MRLTVTYALIALVATAANIGAQELSLRAYDGRWHVESSVLVGTAVGLVLKYVLDKAYIFRFRARDAAHDARVFALYTAMGVVTTLVFWGFELGFHYLFHTKAMRYLGGLIGLAIGYWAKYHLDKRFVFREAAP
ncbi:MAG: GtrA family protein [Enhydrobacter sp.]|nr:MAG: GtrA family protein [Enhydrobacter sp.]